jgi:hypothetical protein
MTRKLTVSIRADISNITNAAYLALSGETMIAPSEELSNNWYQRQSALEIVSDCITERQTLQNRLRGFTDNIERLHEHCGNLKYNASLPDSPRDEAWVLNARLEFEGEIALNEEAKLALERTLNDSEAKTQEKIKLNLESASEYNSQPERWKFPYEITLENLWGLLDEEEPTLSSHYEETESDDQ